MTWALVIRQTATFTEMYLAANNLNKQNIFSLPELLCKNSIRENWKYEERCKKESLFDYCLQSYRKSFPSDVKLNYRLNLSTLHICLGNRVFCKIGKLISANNQLFVIFDCCSCWSFFLSSSSRVLLVEMAERVKAWAQRPRRDFGLAVKKLKAWAYRDPVAESHPHTKQTDALSHSLTSTHPHTQSIFLSYSLSLSLIHTLTCTHTLTLNHAHPFSLSLSLSLSLLSV